MVSNKAEPPEFDINKRVNGLSEIEDFCDVMNMPPPMAKTTYDHKAYTEVAAGSMLDAANELKPADNDDV